MIIGYVLLAFGLAVFVISFLIPAKTEEEKEIEFSEDVIRDMVGKEVEGAKVQLNDIVDETINYAMEKTERSIDRLTNEKMMAVNEYSDTVLEAIDKNHKEVVFLYDMLNDKQENLKDTVSEVDKRASEVRQAVLDAEITVKETRQTLEEARTQANAARAQAENASKQAESAVVQAESISRVSAMDRLKDMKIDSEKNDDFAPLSLEDITKEKTTRKKRTTKPKVKEEAVVFDDDNRLDNTLGLIQTEEISKTPKEAPSLNLGTDVAGKTMGGRNNNERIMELHNQGKSNMAIAKELGLGLGEVKLVIGLFEGK